MKTFRRRILSEKEFQTYLENKARMREVHKVIKNSNPEVYKFYYSIIHAATPQDFGKAIDQDLLTELEVWN